MSGGLPGQIDEAMRSWRTSDRRTAATLWWYSASLELLADPIRDLVARGGVDAAGLGQALRPEFDRVIRALAMAGDVSAQRLRAIASDSLGNQLLAQHRTDLAGPVASAAGLLAPRYIEVPATHGTRTYLRRASCCMIFRLPGQPLCVSCPRQRPADREARLRQHAAHR